MSDRALLVGIDHYDGRPLRGAVNDALRIRTVVKELSPENLEISLVTNGSATREGILEGLSWLASDASPGDRRLFFFSGHGMQLSTIDPSVERDGKDEAVCPFDINLQTGENAIRDKELRRIFEQVPSGVSFTWISDSCCSADLTRGPATGRITKSLPSPAAERRGALTGGLSRSARGLHVAMISACASNGIAQEAEFEQGRSGALTQALLEVLRGAGGLALPLSALVSHAAGRLAQRGFAQIPQIEGDPEIIQRPLWTF